MVECSRVLSAGLRQDGWIRFDGWNLICPAVVQGWVASSSHSIQALWATVNGVSSFFKNLKISEPSQTVFFVSKLLLNGRKTYRWRFDRLVELIILTLPASEHRDRGAAGIISRLLRARLWNPIPVHEYFCRLCSNPFYTFLSGTIVQHLKWQTADLILSGSLVTETGNERCQSPLSPLVQNGRKPPHCLVLCWFFLPPKSQSVSVHRGHLSIGWIFEFKWSSGFPVWNVFCFGPVVCRLLMHKQNAFFSGMLLHLINMHDRLTAHPFTS